MEPKIKTACRQAFEAWVKSQEGNPPELVWIGHSYANNWQAVQWEGWKAAWETKK